MEQSIMDAMPALEMDGFPSEEETSARQYWRKGQMEFWEGTQYFTQGLQNCGVG
jgi:hypothetical protein